MASGPPDGSILPEGWSWGDVGHGALDIVGLVPGWGEGADVANAVWYANEAKYLEAGLSLISVVPIVGDAIGKGGKLAAKLGGPALKKLVPLLRKMDFAKALAPFRKHPKLAPHVDKMVAALEKWRDDLIDRATNCQSCKTKMAETAGQTAVHAKKLTGELATATGKRAAEIADELATISTHRVPGADRVVLGKWPGYINEAKAGGGTWFETPPDFFDDLIKATGSAAEAEKKAWLVNEAFLRQQLKTGRAIEMTAEGLAHAALKPNSMTAKEIAFLATEAKKAGYVKSALGWIKGK